MNRFRNQNARGLMALTLAMDPSLATELRTYIRMGVKDIHPDYMLQRNAEGKVESLDDPNAWNGILKTKNVYLRVILVRHQDGKWAIHGT